MSGEGARFGFSIDISANGAAAAIGDSRFDNEKGRAYLLVRNDLTNTPTFVSTKKSTHDTIYISIVCSEFFFSSIPLLPSPSGNGNGGM